MFIAYPFDPKIHRLCETEVLRVLRRELDVGTELVMYHHQVFKSWVISVLDRTKGTLTDLGLLGEGEAPQATRENVQKIIERVKTTIEAAEAIKRLRRWNRSQLAQSQADQEELFEGFRKVYARLKRVHGPLVAEKWKQMTSVCAIDGLPAV